MVTLEDIAREAGCSVATVSRALSNNSRISAATRGRVREIADQLGYSGSALLRATLQRQHTVGLVIPSIRSGHYYEDVSLLHDVLSDEGYKIILSCHHNDQARDREILQSLIAHPVDGIIHTPCTPHGFEDLLPGAPTIPIVELGSRMPSPEVDLICADEDGAIREIVEYLVGLGHRRIALFTGRKDLFHIRVRTDSFRAALNANSLLKRDCAIVYGPSSIHWFRNAMRELLTEENRPTAVVLGNKPSLVGVLQAANLAGLTLPRDLSLVSFTSEDWHTVTTPPLTTYLHPYQEMGMMAAQLLKQRFLRDEDADLTPKVIRFTGEIIERQSAAPPYDLSA
jgi:LacI family transcriptional regulator